MITGDLDAAFGPGVRSAGTWRPPPGPAAPGRYATTAAFALARGPNADPAAAAAALAARAARLGCVEAACVTGGGYLTVTVTPEALANLAVRITLAGPGCARGRSLAGTTVTAPRHPNLENAPTWDEARRRLAAHLTGRLAEAAGAHVAWAGNDAQRCASPHPDPPARPGSPVPEAIAFAGADAIVYTLTWLPAAGPARVDPAAAAAHRLSNPAYAVRYAHARAASTLRQAADLGLGLEDAAAFRPRLLAHRCELSLLGDLSWLPERVGAAARRGQPGVLARHLQRVARAYLGCQERHPAVWPGMPAGPPGAGPPGTAERLWLAAAVRTALATGLALLGVAAPGRI